MKKPPSSVTTSLRLPEDVFAAVKAEADGDDRSISYIITRVLRAWMQTDRPAVPVQPPPIKRKAAPRLNARSRKPTDHPDSPWWTAMTMNGGGAPVGKAVGIFRAAEQGGVTSLDQALATSEADWKQFGAGAAIMAALDRARRVRTA